MIVLWLKQTNSFSPGIAVITSQSFFNQAPKDHFGGISLWKDYKLLGYSDESVMKNWSSVSVLTSDHLELSYYKEINACCFRRHKCRFGYKKGQAGFLESALTVARELGQKI